MKNKTIKLLLATTIAGTILYTATNVRAGNKEIVEDNNPEIEQVEISEIENNSIKQYEQQEFKKEQIRINNIVKLKAIQDENDRKENVAYHYSNVTIKSGITAEELKECIDTYNPNNNISGLTETLIEAEQKYNINAFFLTAIIAHESTWGKSNRAVNQNNLGGVEVYSPTSEGKTYNSKENSVLGIANFLRRDYLNTDGKYYNGLSTSDVNTAYCLKADKETTDYHWTESINNIANGLESCYHDKVKKLVKGDE